MDGGGIRYFKAGFSKIDITPYGKSVYMGGFDFNRKSTGVLHPIYARAIYISDGSNYVVLVACDVIGLFNEFVSIVRDELNREFTDSGHIVICSTHNHEGPDTMGYWGRAVMNIPLVSGVDSEYMNILKDSVKRVVKDAAENAEDTVIYSGFTDVPSFITENVRKYGYKDDRISFLKFISRDGRTKGFLVNFACHPEGLWAGNTLISADYPGLILKYIEERTGGMGIFFSGALGGMVTPNIEEDAVFADRLRYTVSMGEKLGELIVDEKGNLREIDYGSVLHLTHKFRIRVENPKFVLLRKLGIFRREINDNQIQSEINLIKIGDVVLFGAPGELLPSMGFKIKARFMDFRDVFVLSLCNDELGYILAPEEFREKELYKYEISMSAGKELSVEILKGIYYLRSVLSF
ncbi:MAG: neutral/alkaline non-lysosomal ceramidase N-terminal domain-containing protein [Deltaproteobacteria bacterium]|nr:neutral/alkaline non-lysosomal ceramidase N-terminal domain-containing protein [Deltaproteobacteria bacterium]